MNEAGVIRVAVVGDWVTPSIPEYLLQQLPLRVALSLSKDASAVVTGVTETSVAGLNGVTVRKTNLLC